MFLIISSSMDNLAVSTSAICYCHFTLIAKRVINCVKITINFITTVE
ncbi:hypothetical protein vBEcoMWL3_gp146c [Escherichia phage vB_EcoM_WL-3]|nr:hypothetical protein vBEcoMWL3_gp146c [Escherichia phage vB_EcoM_WL-3]